jgi:hypothetical protein
MINRRLHGNQFCVRKILSVAVLLASFSIEALGASNISGSVRNQSRDEPASGDEVILVRLDRGMQEEARTKTDAQGKFTLTVQYPGKPCLVRVFHQGVSYDQPASAGDALSILVFDAARRVRGVTVSIEILRVATNGSLLHVSDLVDVKNESSPPLTQAGKRTFEVFLPANARIDSVLAAGPGKMGEMISAAPVPDEPGHYTVSFPLRPGATKFAFNYDLPYEGHAVFHTRHEYPLRQLAVMTPPTMRFSSRSSAFEILATGNSRYQVQTSNQLKEGEGPEFEVSGIGALPPLEDQAKTDAPSQSSATSNRTSSAPDRIVLPSLASVDSRWKQTQPPSQSIVLGRLTAVLLAACGLLVWRARKGRNFSAAKTVAPRARQGTRPQPDCKL